MDDFLPTYKDSTRPATASDIPPETRISLADIRSIVGVLLRHWGLIFAILAAVIAATVFILSLIPLQYRSGVQILVVDPGKPANAADNRQLSSLDVDAAAVASVIEVLKSKSLALTVARDEGLDKDPEFTRRSGAVAFLESRVRSIIADLFLPGAKPPGPAVERSDNISPELDRASEELRRRLVVDRLTFSYVLSVSLTSENPDKAQRLATAIANTYLNDQLEAHYEATRRATTWLAGRLDTLKARVVEDDAAIQKLKSENGLTDVGDGNNVSQQQLSDINTQLSLVRVDVAEKHARFEQIQRAAASGANLQSIPEVMASPVIAQLRVQQAEISRRAVDLSGRFGDRYPDVVNAKSQLADISRAIAAEVDRIVGNSKNAYEIAVQRQQSLEKSISAMTGQTGNSHAMVQLQQLQRLADSNRHLYESFLNQFNEIDQKSTLTDMGARIISPAAFPNEPAYPRWTLTLFLAAIAGVVLGIVLAFLIEYIDSGLKTSAQAEQALGHPVLALVPAIRASRLRPSMARTDMLKRLITEPFSQLSDAIRSIRMGVALPDVDRASKIIVVTSAIPGEGKSTLSMLIAASASLSHQRVILVDCDLRRKSVSAAFGMKDKPGLTDILTDKASLGDVTLRDDATMLSLLPGGVDVQNYADLLNSQRMRDLIAQLRAQFDYVILDATPLLPIVDAAVLAQHADKILMVVEWKRTPRASALEALKALRGETRQIAGIVLNKVNFSRLKSYGYGFGYGYSYGYHYRVLSKYYRQR